MRSTGTRMIFAMRMGHADRHEGLKGYCCGVMLPLERKSVEPLAAHLDPRRVRALHQSLHHFVAKSEWSDAAVLARARAHVVAAMDPDERRYWIVDGTGFCKHGRHSVGVARQYCGEIGKKDNCQVAVSVSLATVSASVPIAWRLYLPEEWALDRTRRAKAGVPEAVGFATKPQIALEQLQEAKATDVPQGVVLADAGYGTNTAWRDAPTAEGLNYVVGVISGLKIWPEGDQPLPASYSGRGRPPVRRPRSADGEPLTVEQYAKSLALRCYRSVTWREGSKQALVTIRRRSRARRPRRPRALGGMVARRVAVTGRRATKALPVQPARDDDPAALGRGLQSTLAHRTRLPGPQTGIRPGSLRGPRLARIPPSRHALHRSLRLPRRPAFGGPAPKNPSIRRGLDNPEATAHAVPQRAQRHVPDSIATLRWLIARAIMDRL